MSTTQWLMCSAQMDGVICQKDPWMAATATGDYYWLVEPSVSALLISHQAPILVDLNSGIPDFNFYQNGAQITCGGAISLIGGSGGSGAICAFLQNSGGFGAVDIKLLAADLVTHGCTTCGSYPFPTGVNGVEGLLTFNYVGNTNCFNAAC
ncbi:hypothetical protein B0H17DRAFT_1201315 [Mycena rosella]|uniref:Killer toxin Kp4 domain-containing protein n=1 Tax=Mycena rosella TaxID=1033263 RepID=A0AAD7GJJ5_MYCRO|nr:hypothetical protein B0H17DRAFT_1201315 [Mycena rosella]